MQGEANELKLRVKNRNTIPTQCDVVVIGGGPAGSSVATALAQAGFDVVLFEKERFPRPQVGESIIPHMWRYTDMLGVSDAIRAEGFLAKAGGIIVWDDIIHQMRFSSFGYNDPDRVGLHVERDIFDNLLLQFSVACGANVFEEVAVGKVDFTDNQWPKVDYVDRRGGGFQRGAIACRYVVDGSGHAAVIARQLNARKLVSEEVNYLGIWGYYKNSYFVGVDQRAHPPEDAYAVKPVTFVTSFEDGWIWHIILRESTSVGLVINRGQIKGMGREAQEQYLRESVAKVPILQTCWRRQPLSKVLCVFGRITRTIHRQSSVTIFTVLAMLVHLSIRFFRKVSLLLFIMQRLSPGRLKLLLRMKVAAHVTVSLLKGKCCNIMVFHVCWHWVTLVAKVSILIWSNQ